MKKKDWLDETIETFSEFESPTRYYYWSALAAVSAILQDRVYFDKYLYKLYPNIFVLLFGPSAIKKGPPISLANDIVLAAQNTRVINGRSSVEAILKDLSEAKQIGPKNLIKHNNGFIVASEFSSSLVSSSSSLDILTDLFDRIYRNGDWSYKLKNSEQITLKNPTITLLAASNEALFTDFVPEKNLKGGLIGRTFIISETKRNKLNSLMFKPKIIPDKKKIAEGISHLRELSGEFRMDTDVRHEFEKFYNKFHLEKAPEIRDETGTVGRLDDNILRLAMLISSARRGDLHITADDIAEATEQVIPLVVKGKNLADRNPKGQEISLTQKRVMFCKYLAQQPEHKDSRENILRRFTTQFDDDDLNRIVDTLVAAQVIESTNRGGIIYYQYRMDNPKVRDWIKEKFES